LVESQKYRTPVSVIACRNRPDLGRFLNNSLGIELYLPEANWQTPRQGSSYQTASLQVNKPLTSSNFGRQLEIPPFWVFSYFSRLDFCKKTTVDFAAVIFPPG
jgi:hypothetical protein